MPTSPPRLVRTSDLRSAGLTKRQIRDAVEDGRLHRLRQGAFAEPTVEEDCLDAGRALGRLTGSSELRRLGVFVLSGSVLHIHVEPSASRFRTPTRRHRIHRRTLLRVPGPDDLTVEPLDAVFDAVIGESPRAAIATIDSAMHLGFIRPDELDELFAALPRRFRRLRRLLDARAESGPESMVRLMLRSLGCDFECQVVVDGVGRVDFVVDGWLIVECDSRAHHADWAAQKRDRRRDLEAAKRGLLTLRVIAEDILGRPDEIRAALAGAVSARRRPAYMANQGKRR